MASRGVAAVSGLLKVEAGMLMTPPKDRHIPPELLNVTSELFSIDSGWLKADPGMLLVYRGVLAGDSGGLAAVAGALTIDPGVFEEGAAWLIGAWSSLWDGLALLEIRPDSMFTKVRRCFPGGPGLARTTGVSDVGDERGAELALGARKGGAACGGVRQGTIFEGTWYEDVSQR